MDVPIGEEMGTGDFLTVAATRFSLVMIGVLVSLLVNLVFIPPHVMKPRCIIIVLILLMIFLNGSV